MATSTIHHPVRIDGPTLVRAATSGIPGNLLTSPQMPANVKFLVIDPLIFTHAYFLLGEQPQRFTNDLSLYLACIRTFFERADVEGGIKIPEIANSDSKRRLSEDLGVGIAAYFMVDVFGLQWGSISQIPQNSKLSKKRPDFQGYGATGRDIFEAKGTTKLTKIEPALSKAIGQVKGYPEQAEAKIAVITYLSADERFFPSSSFVVDPPAMPEAVPPDESTSRMLHFEKALQFAGKPEAAKIYLRDLSLLLRESKRENTVPDAFLPYYQPPKTTGIDRITISRTEPSHIEVVQAYGFEFEGRTYHSEGVTVFTGMERKTLEAGLAFTGPDTPLQKFTEESDGASTSVFDDGTLLRIVLPKLSA